MADYNVMLGLELESNAIQEIENQIKNIKCEPIKVDISLTDDKALKFIQDLSKVNKDLTANLLSLNKIIKDTGKQQIETDKQKIDSAKDLLYVYKWLSTIQKEINASEIKIAKLDKSSKQFQTLSEQVNKLKTSYLSLYKIGLKIDGFDINSSYFNQINASFDKTQRQIETIKSALSDKQVSKSLKEQEQELISLAKKKSELRVQKTKLDSDSDGQHNNELEWLKNQIKDVEDAYNNLRNTLKKQLPAEQFESLKNKTQEIYEAEILAKQKIVKIANDKQLSRSIEIREKNSLGSIDTDYDKAKNKIEELCNVSTKTQNSFEDLTTAYRVFKDAIKAEDISKIVATYNKFKTTLEKVNGDLKQEVQIQKINDSVYQLSVKKTQFGNEINAWLKQNSNATKQFGSRIKNIQQQLESCNDISLGRLKNEFEKITQEASVAGKVGLNFVDTLKKKGKELLSYYTISSSFYKIVDTAKQAYQNVANVDSAMTNLYKVTDNTDEEYSTFFQNAKQEAKDLGVTLTDYITATSEWSKLGYDLDVSPQLAKVSSIYQNVGEVDAETAVKDIVTALKAYNINVDDAMSIVDKFNKLGNEFAVSSNDLGTGLKVSASSLAVAGNDINKSLAMLTGGGEITQDIGELGNGLKTISMRLRGKHTCLHIGKVYMLCCA